MTMDYLIHLANYSDGVLYLMVAILTVALAVIIDRFCSGTCAAPFYKAIAWWGAWGPSTRPPGPHSRAWPLWPPSCRRPCYWMWRLGIGGLIMAVMVVLGLMCPILVTTGLRQKPRSAHLVAPPRPLPPLQAIPKVVPVRPKPLLRPIPRSVVHHRPVPLPVPVERIVLRAVRSAPPRPALPRPPRRPCPPRWSTALRSRFGAVSRPGLLCRGSVAAFGISGHAVMAFKRRPRGRLLSARVVRSSGIALIDRAA